MKSSASKRNPEAVRMKEWMNENSSSEFLNTSTCWRDRVMHVCTCVRATERRGVGGEERKWGQERGRERRQTWAKGDDEKLRLYLFWTTAPRALRRFSEPHSENWRNKTQTEMRDTLKHPTVVTGYLEGNASSLICLVWLETPNQTFNPQSQRKPTEFNSRWWNYML